MFSKNTFISDVVFLFSFTFIVTKFVSFGRCKTVRFDRSLQKHSCPSALGCTLRWVEVVCFHTNCDTYSRIFTEKRKIIFFWYRYVTYIGTSLLLKCISNRYSYIDRNLYPEAFSETFLFVCGGGGRGEFENWRRAKNFDKRKRKKEKNINIFKSPRPPSDRKSCLFADFIKFLPSNFRFTDRRKPSGICRDNNLRFRSGSFPARIPKLSSSKDEIVIHEMIFLLYYY